MSERTMEWLLPLARTAWRISETLEAIGDWAEDRAVVVKPESLRTHLRRSWLSERGVIRGPRIVREHAAPPAIRKDVGAPRSLSTGLPLTIDLRSLAVRAAAGLHDAATVGGAPQTYLKVERELRALVAVLDEIASRGSDDAS